MNDFETKLSNQEILILVNIMETQDYIGECFVSKQRIVSNLSPTFNEFVINMALVRLLEKDMVKQQVHISKAEYCLTDTGKNWLLTNEHNLDSLITSSKEPVF